MRFYDGFEFKKKIKKICMEKAAGEQGLALQQHFPQMYFESSKNSNGRINTLFNARDLKLGHFGIFGMLFPFLAFFKL